MQGRWGVPGYTEIRELGNGATGRVVLAASAHDEARVAIKYLSEELRADVGFVARFRHEARLLSTMRGPHNARLIDYLETREGSAIIMELVNGVPLRELLGAEGPTGPEAALSVLKGSLHGLAAAHALGVVHRDFKPENVMIQVDGSCKLLDFGIAVRAGEGTAVAGSPAYMAPEQWAGSALAPTADVYAATVVFYECLTGNRPYRASSPAALAHQHRTAAPPVDDVPEQLRGLVERGLAKQPGERPPSAEALLSMLEAVAAASYGPDWEERGRRTLARMASMLLLFFPEPVNEADIVLSETPPDRGGRKRRGRRPVAMGAKVVIGVVFLGVVAGAAVLVVNGSDDTPALRTQSVQSTPTPPPLEVPVTDEPAEEPSETPTTAKRSKTPRPTPTPTPPVRTVAPSVKPSPSKTKTPTPTPTPTRTPSRTPTRTTPAPTPTPSETPYPELTGSHGLGETPPPPATTLPPTGPAPTGPGDIPATG
ncbi:serine/threonine-protein kinase [Nonomuraea longicatena]|uniref:Protein kinase domain-containing protein n=1 Tax=Nonomuraea longicatena TaxID=83682 RepID=A0ABP3Z4Y5_9ACTN